MPDYLDTSAFIKLIRSEAESRALRAELERSDGLVSSALLLVEGHRAAARYGELAVSRAGLALRTVTLVPIDETILERAAGLDPPELRSLDALHLATALGIGDDLNRIYCYDARLAAAASASELDVARPGAREGAG